MPVITVRIAKGRPVERKRALAEAVTNSVAQTLDGKPEWVTVLIDEYDQGNWSTGGQLHSDKLGPGHGKAGDNE